MMASLSRLKTVFLYLVVSTLVKGNYELKDVTFTAVNLNVTIMWSPLNIDAWRNETIYYTVIHSQLHGNTNVPGCTNITRVVCNLVHIYGDGNTFSYFEHFMVTFASNQRRDVRGSVFKTLFDHYVDVSAPVIQNTIINPRNVTVWLHGPPTPFKKNNITLIMGDVNNVGGYLFAEKLCFKSSLSNLDDPEDNKQSNDWTCSRNGTHMVTYNSLHPHTRYLFKAYNKIQWRNSQEKFVTWEFRTTQEAPELSPYITHHEVEKRNCDVRDVVITWQERTQQRSNVEITHYIVTCVSEESGEQIEMSVPASQNQSTVIRGLNRWTNHAVTVRSVNSHGNATSEIYYIPPDEPDNGSYRVRNMNITGISGKSAYGRLSWDPPSRNTECISGYQIKTFIDGSLEETITLQGGATSTDLKFKKIGRYIVEVEPIVKNSKGITGDASIKYDVKGSDAVLWVVLVVIFFLICFTLTAVIVMTRKVLCDASRLPDFTKTLSVRLASHSDVFIGTLKSPPDREYFHATRSSHTTSIMLTTHFGDDDDVFEPNSTSTGQLLTKTKDPKGEDKHSDGISEKNNLASDKTYIKLSTYMTRKKADETTDRSSAKLNTSGVGKADGYVAHHSVKVKTDLTVYIPKEEHLMKTTEGAVSPQSSSSDSGISSSAYTGSLSDCVPPSPFSDIDTSSPDTSRDIWYGYDVQSSEPFVRCSSDQREDLESPYVKRADVTRTAPFTRDSYGYDLKSASPYVKTCTAPQEIPQEEDSAYVKSELAGKPGRIKSTSDPGADRSAQSGVYLKGYLPMSPSIPENFNQYSKLSPKYE